MGHAVCTGEMEDAYKILVGKPEGKRQLEGPRHGWKGIRMDLKGDTPRM
jgi:hypothetical protein